VGAFKQKLLGLLILLIITAQSAFSHEKTYFSDSISFFDFLTNQEQVPGLKFRFTLPPDFKFSEETPTLWTKSEKGVWFGNSLDSVSQINRFQILLDSTSIARASFEYLIYNEPADFDAASDFVSALLRSNDIFPLEKKRSSSEELVILAQDSPFEPEFDAGFGYFSDFKIFMITTIILVFILTAGGMIFFMIIFKSKRNKRELLRKEFTKSIAAPLSQILFEKTLEEVKSMSDEELGGYFPSQLRGKDLYNEVLIENIISLNKKMKGEFKDKLKALFRRLGLNKISESKVKRKKWDFIVSGLVQINEMDLEEYLPLVREQLYSPNFHVRSNATATFLNLSREVDLSFLKNLRYPLSNWQQMNYLRIIKYLYPTRNLLMAGLLDSENLTVRLFGYKLVRMVGRVDLVENLGSIADKASEEEKIEILKTIEAIGVVGYTGLINSSMKSSDYKLAIQAIKVAGSLGDKSSEVIILGLLEADPGFKMKMALLKGLKDIDTNSFEALVATSQDPETKEIYNHLTDPLLSHV
jgi:hypothetical protein